MLNRQVIVMKKTSSTLSLVRFYESSSSQVRSYFRRHGFRDADADDLTQETFVQAVASLDTLKDPDKTSSTSGPWLGSLAPFGGILNP